MPFGQHEDRIATNFGVSLRTPGTRRIAIIKHGRPGRSQLSCFSFRRAMKKFTLLTGFAKIELCFSKRVFQTGKGAFSRRNHALAAGPEKRSFFRTSFDPNIGRLWRALLRTERARTYSLGRTRMAYRAPTRSASYGIDL